MRSELGQSRRFAPGTTTSGHPESRHCAMRSVSDPKSDIVHRPKGPVLNFNRCCPLVFGTRRTWRYWSGITAFFGPLTVTESVVLSPDLRRATPCHSLSSPIPISLKLNGRHARNATDR
jgi:hypothetical protein